MRTVSPTSQTNELPSIDIGIERTDVDTGPSELSQLLGGVDLRP